MQKKKIAYLHILGHIVWLYFQFLDYAYLFYIGNIKSICVENGDSPVSPALLVDTRITSQTQNKNK